MRWVLLLAVVSKLAAQCGISPSPTAFDGTNGSTPVPAAGGTFTVTIGPDTSSSCSWTAVTNTPWITLGKGGTGPGTFTFTVVPNTSAVSRSGSFAMTGNWLIKVLQLGAVCNLTLGSTSASVPVGGGSGSFSVQTACDWNAFSNNYPWLTVASPGNGTGNGSVTYNVSPNVCVVGRSGSIGAEAGYLNPNGLANPILTFQLTQDGSPNNLTLSPATVTTDVAGATGRITLITGANCNWSALADSSWIQIQNGFSGTGSSFITYNIPPNNGAARTGHIIVGPQIVTISQAGGGAPVPQLTTVVNAASYAGGPIAPGEVVALGGTGLGPAKGLGAQLAIDGKSLSTAIGGVQVLFDGKYPGVPTYVSSSLINVIAPYEIAGQTKTEIQVQYGGASSSIQAQVQAAAPGIFTQDFNGLGTAAVLNQDYSLNGRSSPAARGSYVMIFCTGGGATNPPSTDAAITSGAPPLTLPVTVTIGGIPSPQVNYAGGAPGAVAGLTQINALVPPDAPTGAGVSLVVQVGSWQSPPGVTIVVQ